jgi:glycosyltransferase involved in cell wall biosynthesis
MPAVRDKITEPLVSFVIPARNEEKIIGTCLDAIGKLACERRLWECILVDNGSADATEEIASARGARVFVVPDGTISRLRNLGAKKAKGDFLAFIDADCVIDKDWLRNALPRFQDPAVGCVGSHPDIPEECSWVQKAWNVQTRRKRCVEEVDWLPSMNMLVRKDAFVDSGGFDESLITCEDVDFCYRLKKRKYKIISDCSVRAIHFGEARTVLEFFRKERWRGQSNLRGLLLHGIYLRELPSLALPVFYLILMAFFPVAMVHSFLKGFHVPLLVNLGSLLLPPLLLSVWISLRVRDLTRFAELTLLYYVYSLARAVAVIPVQQQGRYKDLSTQEEGISRFEL